MATLTEKAAAGQRAALEGLYSQNKQNVFFIAKSLLLNEKQAEDVTVGVFQNMFRAIAASGISTEEEFANEAMRMAVGDCQKKVSKQNSKAFRIPPNKNFRITDTDSYDGSESYTDFALRVLPELQRFLFVANSLCKFDAVQTAKLAKIPQNLIPHALEAEKTNMEKLLAAAGKTDASYESLIEDLEKSKNSLTVPATADKQISAAIDSIAKPGEQKKKKQMTIAGIAAASCLVIVIGLAYFLGSRPKNTDSSIAEAESETVLPESGTEATTSGLDETLSYYADIEIKDHGTITVALDQKSAPITTENFVNLAESGFYDGLTFHRIMEGFMMQGGDPEGTGMGGSDHTITGEFSENGYDNELSHTRGAIAMARSSDYDSASSQFYIVHEDSTFLDGQYAVFGYVTEGMDIVDDICESAEPTDDNGTIPAEAQPVISSITIRTE